MNKTAIHFKLRLTLIFLCSLCFDANTQQPAAKNTATIKSSGYAPVNGLKMYYEIHGEGKPLILLHGSYMNIPMNYGMMIPGLAKNHRVIAVEMQGHGRTADIDRPYSFEALADDIAGLLKYLKIERADVLGYSFGATVALEFAIKHPQMIDNLVFISSVYKMDGWIKPARDIFPTIVPEFFERTPLKTEYDRLAPDTSHWRMFVNKLSKFGATPFDLGADNVKNIKCPVLLIKADNDGVELSHVSEMYTLLGGGIFGDMTGLPKSQLAIIPAKTHVTLMMDTDQLLAYINPFLEAKR